MTGGEVAIRWHGRPARAWVPAPLSERELGLSEDTVRRTEQALALARRGSDALPEHWEPLARLLLRAEGLASSAIEEVRAPIAEVALAELDPDARAAPRWVAQNLAVVRAAVEEAHVGPLDVSSLDRWHRTLMADVSHLPPSLIGARRDVQGWIGGTSPLEAAYVPPPPEHLAALIDDVVGFANRIDVDPVTQAAVAHAQFETIHPYADGNGRIGRVLIGWILTRRVGLVTPPPVSVHMATDRGGYLSGLTRFRLGELDPWVRWFADVLARAAETSIGLVRAVGELQDRWRERLGSVRQDSAARRVLELLPHHPVLSASTIADSLGVSERSSRTALATLAAHGIVEPFEPLGRRPGRPRHWWAAPELMSVVVAVSG